MRIYIVQRGDDLQRISERNNVDIEKLIQLNKHISNPEQIIPGMKLHLPNKTSEKKEEITNYYIAHSNERPFGSVIPINQKEKKIRIPIKQEEKFSLAINERDEKNQQKHEKQSPSSFSPREKGILTAPHETICPDCLAKRKRTDKSSYNRYNNNKD